jgi:hypothetical protein
MPQPFRHTRVLVPLLALVVLTAAACGPKPAAGPPPVSTAAISQAFSPYGPTVVAQATKIARCESGLVPTAGAGRYYQGLFQLGRHIVAINNYGGNYLDPYQNAQAARDLYVTRGYSWSAWSCRP